MLVIIFQDRKRKYIFIDVAISHIETLQKERRIDLEIQKPYGRSTIRYIVKCDNSKMLEYI
jgi:hypothetical protein